MIFTLCPCVRLSSSWCWEKSTSQYLPLVGTWWRELLVGRRKNDNTYGDYKAFCHSLRINSGNQGELIKPCPCHGGSPLIAEYHDCCRLLAAVVMTDDASSGCCLFVHIWSSSHTYIVENVHDNNLCLYPFIMLVVDLLLPENALFLLQFQNPFTYVLLILCIQFTLFYVLFT